MNTQLKNNVAENNLEFINFFKKDMEDLREKVITIVNESALKTHIKDQVNTIIILASTSFLEKFEENMEEEKKSLYISKSQFVYNRIRMIGAYLKSNQPAGIKPSVEELIQALKKANILS